MQGNNAMEKNIDGHIDDLKKVIMHTGVAFIAAFAFSWFKVSSIMLFLIYNVLPKGYVLHYFTLESVFFTNVRIAFFAGLIISFPFILWRLAVYFRCLASNISIAEISIYSLISAALFAIGIYCGVYFIVPKFVIFMLNMANNAVNVKLNVASFINTVMFLNLIIGFVFQLPVLFFMLIKTRILTAEFMVKIRGWYVIVSFVLGAVFTPPDVFSQIFVALFFILVFEIALIFARIFQKKNG